MRQFATQPYHDARRVKISDIKKVFVTHMHGGLPVLVSVISRG